MSSSLPGPRNDFAKAALPDPHEEIEIKFDVQDKDELQTVVGLVSQHLKDNAITKKFWELNPEPFYSRRNNHILHTNPVSVYIDDNKLTLRGTKGTLRKRLTPTLPNHIEFGVKGKARGFTGAGNVVRHEHEVVTNSHIFPVELLSDARTREILAPIMGREWLYYFATDVSRDVIALPVNINGKRCVFEFCADPIKFIKPDPKQPRSIRYDFSLLHYTQFGESNGFEIEYMHPKNQHPEMAALAKQLGLATNVTMPEIADAMEKATEIVMSLSQVAGVELIPTDVSKGDLGFQKLAALNEDVNPYL